ncbi:MAG TPA: UDP-N-acetylglucosamine--N-acetylmuramyl-(pentapeptide) pyrophosphoryl-undecaprenol N-acetylglucosamine transferase [Patescibacteria group bacterium]|nr:UDP-N-acetylglucosamine--N-acetylmuramyl-(pentapeptide) pyrophosphoryl-undecaprenol N-acetylglucosamine transferase [Patescibacteria group bacterium]
MKVILAGGGTGGPTIPLLAVAEQLKKIQRDAELLFIGAGKQDEQLLAGTGIKFVATPAGKWRRYFSLANVADMFRILHGYFAAKKILKQFQPNVVFTAGSFAGVPVCYAARNLKIPVLMHQQDARIGLANKLVAPFADYITTAFARTAKEFHTGTGFEAEPKIRTEWTGNPVREDFLNSDIKHSRDFFHLTSDLPILLIFGGATGAAQINEVVLSALPELLNAHQIIHITGAGKKIDFNDPNYHQYEFLGPEMPDAFKIADIVVARAGLSTIAELSALGKVSIIVPMPDSHQEDNAEILSRTNSAVVLTHHEFTPETLARVIVSLKFNVKRCELLSRNIAQLMPHDSATRIAKIILERYGKQS